MASAILSKRPSDEVDILYGSESPKRQRTEVESTTVLASMSSEMGKKMVKKVIVKRKRPAPPQVDPATFKSEPPPQTGTIFNIWYNKWSGGDRDDKLSSQTHAKGRCNIAKHSGYTKADSMPGSHYCLFFARGICHRGRECEYLHRLPSADFDVFSGHLDCFGREKHADYRDDMGGVGTFTRQNRTLYIGQIHPTDDVEEVVSRHFAEWGQIERTRVLPQRGVAFVTYTTEAQAQFAKESMAHQSLDGEEVLNVRWATQDPNPAARKRDIQTMEEQAANAIRKALPEAFVRELEGHDPDAKRRRREEGTMGLEGYEASDAVWFEREKARQQVEAAQEQSRTTVPDQPLRISHEIDIGGASASAGLLTSSTLAALASYTPDTHGTTYERRPMANLALGLVDYDSDED